MIKLSSHQRKTKLDINNIKSPVQRLIGLRSFCSEFKKFKFDEKLVGLLSMIKALDYHYNNHHNIEEKAKKGETYEHARYEAMAYIVKVGLVKSLFISWWQEIKGESRIKLDDKMLTISSLIQFRNKRAAHRQEDSPNESDCSEPLCDSPLLIGRIPKRKIYPAMEKLSSYEDILEIAVKKEYRFSLQYQLATSKGKKRNIFIFLPSRDHKSIMFEIFSLLDFILFNE
ncbi:hypothetical protein KAH94_01185 [bacterium]|nr:hypothetical protein [bacterium]